MIGRATIGKPQEKEKKKTFPKEWKAQFGQGVTSRQRSS